MIYFLYTSHSANKTFVIKRAIRETQRLAIYKSDIKNYKIISLEFLTMDQLFLFFCRTDD